MYYIILKMEVQSDFFHERLVIFPSLTLPNGTEKIGHDCSYLALDSRGRLVWIMGNQAELHCLSASTVKRAYFAVDPQTRYNSIEFVRT